MQQRTRGEQAVLLAIAVGVTLLFTAGYFFCKEVLELTTLDAAGFTALAIALIGFFISIRNAP